MEEKKELTATLVQFGGNCLFGEQPRRAEKIAAPVHSPAETGHLARWRTAGGIRLKSGGRPLLIELEGCQRYTAFMPEDKRPTENCKDKFASADRELEQLVHLISSKFNGDTRAFFNSIDPKPRVNNDSAPDYDLVRSFFRKSF